MIDLDLVAHNGVAVYLDVQSIEARQTRAGESFALTGTLGDGSYEGQVLVEIGSSVEVTFIDEWLGRPGVHEFFRHIEREDVDAALISAAERLLFCVERFPVIAGEAVPRVTGYHFENKCFSLRPQEYAQQLELPLAVGDRSADWQRRAA